MKRVPLPTSTNYTIPKIKKKKVDQKEAAAAQELEKVVPAPEKGWSIREAEHGAEMFGLTQRFAESADDKDMWAQARFQKVYVIENKYLTWKFNECKRVFRSQSVPDTESLGFREIYSQKEANFISQYGLRVGTTHLSEIGDSQLGVYVYKSPDLTSSTLHYYDNLTITIMMFKTLRGKPHTIGLASGDVDPQPGSHCHVATKTDDSTKNEHNRRHAHLLSAVYHYEYPVTGGFQPRKYPATVLPYAIAKITFDIPQRMHNPNGLLSKVFPTFTYFNISDSQVSLQIPGCEPFFVSLMTPLRNGQVPEGLFDGEFVFGDDPFYGAKSFASFPEIQFLRGKTVFGKLIEQVEVIEEFNEQRYHATYSIYQPPSTHNPKVVENRRKFLNLMDSMRVSGAFLVAVDSGEVRHFMLPSGELASSLGLPFIADIIHVISVATRDFYTNEFSVSKVFEAESRYATEQFTKERGELNIDSMFLRDHEDCYSYFNKINILGSNIPRAPIYINNHPNARPSSATPTHTSPEEDDGWVDRILPPIPLPPPGKSILYKGPPTVPPEKGAPIGHKPKRNPGVRVKWATNVVDNCNKTKDASQIEKEKVERKNRTLTPEETEELKETNDYFKSVMSSFSQTKQVERKDVNAFGVETKKVEREKTPERSVKPMEPVKPVEPMSRVEIPKPFEIPKRVEIPNPVEIPKRVEIPKPVEVPNRFEIPKPVEIPKRFEVPKPVEIPKPFEIPKPVEPPKTIDYIKPRSAVNFSSIKSLPLPNRTPSSDIPLVIASDVDDDDDEKALAIVEDEPIETSKKSPEKDVLEVVEEVPVLVAEEKVVEEENDILSFCMSSTKPKEAPAPSVSTESVGNSFSMLLMNLGPETRELLASKKSTAPVTKDIDLRDVQQQQQPQTPTIQFQLNKPKPVEPVIVKPAVGSVFGEQQDEDIDYRKIQNVTTTSEAPKDSRRNSYSSSSSRRSDDGRRRDRDRDRDSYHRDRDRDRDSHRRRRSRSRSKERERERERDRERDREREKDKDLRRIPVPTSHEVDKNEKSSRNRLENQLHGYLKVKDYDTRVDEKNQMRPPTPTSSHIFEVLGISNQNMVHLRQATSTENVLGTANSNVKFDSPASPEPAPSTSEPAVSIPTTVILETPESPKSVSMEIEEIEEVTPMMPFSFIPQTKPLVVPTVGDDGWETKYGKSEAKERRKHRKMGHKNHDANSARNTTKIMRQAENSWTDALNKRKQQKDIIDLTDTEEDGEILSEGDDEVKEADSSIEIIESPPRDDIMEVPAPQPKVIPIGEPVIIPDRDDRVPPQRRSRFDKPPLNNPFYPGAQPHMQQNFGVPTNGPLGPPPPLQFFNAPVFQPPGGTTKAPLLPGGPTVSRFGGPGGMQIPIGQRVPGIGQPMHNQQPFMGGGRFGQGGGGGRGGRGMFHHNGGMRQQQQPTPQRPARNVVVVADSIMFNRAVMDSSMFQELCECLRTLLMKGLPTKLYVHQQIFNNLVTSSNETHKLYSAILLKHKDTIVFVLDAHKCDITQNRGQADAEECMMNIARRYPNHDVVYLSNLSQDSALGAALHNQGVRIHKLDSLMQLLQRY